MIRMKKLKKQMIAFALVFAMVGSLLSGMAISGGSSVVKAEGGDRSNDYALPLGPELVVNGGFSTGSGTAEEMNGDNTATLIGVSNWTAFVPNESKLPLDFNITEEGMLTVAETEVLGFANVSENLVLEAGTYVVSIRIKPVGEMKPKTYVEFNAAKMKSGLTKRVSLSDTNTELTPGTDGWIDLSYEFTLTAKVSNKSMRIRINGVDDDVYWLLDDFRLVQKGTTENLLEYRAFEDMVGYKPDSSNYLRYEASDSKNSVLYCASADSGIKMAYDFEVIKESETSDNAVLKISKAKIPAIGQVSSALSEPVEAGKFYKVSADVLADGITDFSDTEKAEISFIVGGEKVTVNAADLAQNGNKVSAEISIPATVADGADMSNIMIEVNNFAKGTWTIDNVSLKEVITDPTLEVSGAATEVEQGGSLALTATLDDPLSQTMGGVTWKSDVDGVTVTADASDSAKATVAVASTVVAETEVTITATVLRNNSNEPLTATYKFKVAKAASTLTKIEITEDRLELKIGEQEKPEVTLAPDDAVNKELIWTTSDEDVATVEADGTITAIGVGRAVITATSKVNSAVNDSIMVNVTKIIIDNGTFDETTAGLKAEIAYVDSNGKNKEQIVDFKNDTTNSKWKVGRLSGDTASNAVVYFEVINEDATDNAVKISRNTADKDKVIKSVLYQTKRTGFVEGAKYQITAYVKSSGVNADATAYIRWYGDKLDGTGNAHYGESITASDCKNGYIAITYEFTCGTFANSSPYGHIMICFEGWKTGEWYVDDVSIVQLPADPYIEIAKNLEVEITKQPTMEYTLFDLDNALGDNPAIVWTSDDETVVKVDETGKLIPVGLGTAAVMAKASSADGQYEAVAQCLVTIIPEIVNLTDIELGQTTLALQVGGQKKLDVIYTPADATDKTLVWTSSNETVAKVSADGTVTALGAGEAVITVASAKNSSVSAQCTVTVSASNKITAGTASFTTPYGNRLEGSLADKVANATGEKVVFTLYDAPAHGIMTVNADGTFSYAPGVYPKEGREVTSEDEGWIGSGWPEGEMSGFGGTYTFKVLVTAGDESAVLEGTIVEKDLTDTLEALELTGNHLMFSEESIAAVKAAIQVEGSFKQKAWKDMEAGLSVIVNTAPPKYDSYTASTNKESVWQRDVADKTTVFLVGYLLSGKEVYKQKAFEYALAIAEYPYWSEGESYGEGSLTAAHNAFAVAMVYDWLKDDPIMTAEARQTILTRLYYAGQCIYNNRTQSFQYVGNHFMLGANALVSVATALYLDSEEAADIIRVDVDPTHLGKDFSGTITKEELKAECAKWLKWTCGDIGQALDWFPDEGTGFEGFNYFQYGISYLLNAMLILEEEFGIDVFTGSKYLETVPEFVAYVTMSEDYITRSNFTFDYNDGYRNSSDENVPIMSVLAAKYDNAQARYLAEMFLDKNVDGNVSKYWLTLFFGDDEAEAEKITTSEPFYSSEMGYLISRSNWSGKESILFAKSGLPLGKNGNWIVANSKTEYHMDPDANSFMLFAYGDHLIRTDGRGYKDSMNHSTLLVGGESQIGSFSASATNSDKKNNVMDDFVNLGLEPKMTLILSTPEYDYFVGDATEAYYPQVGLQKFERHFIHLKTEDVLLIVDNIKTMKNTDLELRWFPESKIVAENYGIYSVYGANTTMNFYPFTEGVETVFADLEVLIEDYETEKAFAQTYTGSSWQNAVAFSWAPKDESQVQVNYQLGTNPNEHQYEVNGKIYTINVGSSTLSVEEGSFNQASPWKSDSTLTKILFNGEELEVFDKATTEYELDKCWKTLELDITPVASAPTATVVLDWNGECPGTATITVTSEDGTSTTVYTLNFTNEQNILGISSAVSEPNVSGKDITLTYDNFVASDSKTKTWSSINNPVVTYDMGSVVDIAKIDIAFNASSIRENFFNIYISIDGENWTLIHGDKWNEAQGVDVADMTDGTIAYNSYQTVYSGETLRTRYVRFALRGNNTKTTLGTFAGLDDPAKYGAIQEVTFYGTEASGEVVNPEIIPERTNTEYKQESGETVTITSNGEFSKFENVEMDGVVVAESNYTAVEGSTVITFKAEYLNSLAPGRHTVTINYEGEVSVDSVLTIEEADDPEGTEGSEGTEGTEESTEGSEGTEGSTEGTEGSTEDTEGSTEDTEGSTEGSTEGDGQDPDTGDTNRFTLWIALMVVCMLGAIADVVIKKKRS